MSAAGTLQIELLLPADTDQRGKSPAHAVARRAIYPDPLLWVTKDGRLAEHSGASGGTQTGTKVDADHGFGNDLPEAENQRARAEGPEVSVLGATA